MSTLEARTAAKVKMKSCTKCGGDKPRESFHSNKNTRSGLASWCKDCTYAYTKNHRKKHGRFRSDKEREGRRIWDRNNPDKIKNQRLKMAYGITLAEFNEMLAAQDGVCAISGESFGVSLGERPNVDHCHLTGKIRGIIKHKYNRGIGLLGDCPIVLEKAACYLRKHRAGKV
jgi:hypothetical protein